MIGCSSHDDQVKFVLLLSRFPVRDILMLKYIILLDGIPSPFLGQEQSSVTQFRLA